MAYYFREDDDEFCYTEETIKEYMQENFIKEMVIYEAKRETGTGYFFCKEYSETGEIGESCGRLCKDYKPLNGKNGRCVHYGWPYEQTDKSKILKINLPENKEE